MKRILATLATATLVLASCRRSEAPVAGSDSKPAGLKPAAAAAPVGIDVGSTMPAYSVPLLDGTTLDLEAKRGKVVLLNLWATWCGPCRYEIPELQRMHDRFSPRGFEVVGVSVDEGGIEGVRAFVAEQKMTYPVALDEKGNLATLLQTSVLPTTVLIDRNGKILWKRFGAITENDAELNQAIESAL